VTPVRYAGKRNVFPNFRKLYASLSIYEISFYTAVWCSGVFISLYNLYLASQCTYFWQQPDPDPNFFHPGSTSKNLSYYNPKLFLSSQKYDPGCSSQIRFKKALNNLNPVQIINLSVLDEQIK
jgi:hypothetical protein